MNIGGRDIKYYVGEKLLINCYDNEETDRRNVAHLQHIKNISLFQLELSLFFVSENYESYA